MVYFRLIFLVWSSGQGLLFFQMNIQLFHHHLLKILLVLHSSVWVPLSKIRCIFVDVFLDSLASLTCLFLLLITPQVGISVSFQNSDLSFSGRRILSYHWELRWTTTQVPHIASPFPKMWNITSTWFWCGILQVECVLALNDFSLFRYERIGVIHLISLQDLGPGIVLERRHEWAQTTEQPKTLVNPKGR